ncbi:MAG: valine--tRNA ligase [Acidobacteria bacterium]|nr:valine--tRNA ligase [Acidobacteriota bacterium]
MSQTEIPKVYNPQEAEKHWYPLWESRGYFKPEVHPDGKPYCIVIPPPNVTGYLHMGHALQHTLMDILTRWRRMQGYKALWLPGTDHAGISTQVVVERQLAAEGLTREALGREEFEKRVWQWKEHSGGTIQRQMRLEGASVDWSRERFTLDEGLSRAVREAFVRLYEEGLIHRGSYIVNWCPRCLTALSDLEAPKQEVHGKLYYIAYPIKKPETSDQRGPQPSSIAGAERPATSDHIIVATTRPETMLGDTAIAINPTDERYQHLRGAIVILPIMKRELPVIETELVEKGFGTGVVKVTPAHDPADYEIGRQYKLPAVVVIDKNGCMTAEAGRFAGLDRFEARRQILEALEKSGLLVQVEEYTHSVGHCDRCHTVIEPLVSMQWFLNVKAMAEEAIQAVKEGRTRFVPSNWEKIYFDWLENIRDWCISRQLWWGHRIPAWYCPEAHITVSRETPTACAVCGRTELAQDEDVLDTWFSSALWPFSTLGWPDDTDDLRTFYPTSVLLTAFDIIFFWVARMMMMGLTFMKNHPSRPHAVDPDSVPFHTVFITGLIRDPYGQKMSKMKGNVIDPLQVFEQYGTDAVRFTLTAAASPGTDIALQYSKMESYRNFCNKIWNAARFVLMNSSTLEASDQPPTSRNLALHDRWILSELHRTIAQVNLDLEEFRFHEAAQSLYHFFWDDFCDWYIEFSKAQVSSKENTPEVQAARQRLVHVLETALRMLHPLMPLITEELWQRLPRAKTGESICLAPFPVADAALIDVEAERQMQIIIELIKKVRNIRSELNIDLSKELQLLAHAPNGAARRLIEENSEPIKRLARVRIEFVSSLDGLRHVARDVVAETEIALPLEGLIDFDKESARLTKNLAKIEKEVEQLNRRLTSPDFLERAAEDVVASTRERYQELQEKQKRLTEILQDLR